jgi:uncharacterized repeat protein (TIGR01451 family)
MVALKELHRRLHSRDNKDLINREVSSDDYDMDEIDEMEINSNKKEGSELENKEIEKKQNLNEEYDSKQNLNEEMGDFRQADNSELMDNNTKMGASVVGDLNTPPPDEDFGIILNEEGEAPEKKFMSKKIKIAIAVVLSLLVLIGGAIAYIKYKQGSFKPENVLIEFHGDAEIRSGDLLTYKLLIKNENRASLKNAVLKINYPEELIVQKANFMRDGPSGSFYIDVGNINSFETRDFELKFNVFSPYGNQPYLKAELSYQPDNFSSEFVKTNNHLFDIKGAVVSFSLISPNEAASGELVKFIGVLTNNSVNDFDNLILEMEYSDDFEFESSGLEMIDGENNKFKITNLKAGEKREVEVVGSFVGQTNSVKRMVGKIGVLGEDRNLSEISLAEESIKIIPSRVALEQEIISGVDEDLTVKAGDTVRYRIKFKNNSSSPLLDLILKESLEGSLIDESSVQATNGYYNLDSKEIVWKASDVPVLKKLNPGEEGVVEFQYMVKENFVPEDEDNQALKSQVKISSSNVDVSLLHNKEINSESKILKVKTNLDVLVSGSFGEGPFKNSGPLPVKAGEETTFTIKVSLKNSFNKINKPNLTIKLPSGIIWKDSFHRSSGNVNFNDRTNELKWEMNSLSPQVGYKNPTEELIFQIGIIPQKDGSNREVVLVNEVVLNGFEEFIEKQLVEKVDNFKLVSVEDYDF